MSQDTWPLPDKPGKNARVVVASQGVRIWTTECVIESFGDPIRLTCTDETTLQNLEHQQRIAFTILNGAKTVQGSGIARVSSTGDAILVEPYRLSSGKEIFELRLKGWTKLADAAPPDISRYAFWYQAFRLVTIPLSALPVLVAGGAAFAEGNFHPWLLLLSLIGAVAAHAGANATADYFDFKKGVDSSKALSSHLGALARERVEPERILLAAMVCFFVTAFIGLVLVQIAGWELLLFGVAGLVGAFTYTGRPFSYKYRALGELMLGILVGPVIVMGAWFVQTGDWDWAVFLISAALGMLISSISLVNNLRDMPDDKAAGIKTLPMALGVSNTKRLYYILTWGPYFVAGIAILLQPSFWPLVLILVSVPLALRAYKALHSTKDDIDEIRLKSQTNPYPLNSIRLHVRFGTLAVAGLIIAGGIRLIWG